TRFARGAKCGCLGANGPFASDPAKRSCSDNRDDNASIPNPVPARHNMSRRFRSMAFNLIDKSELVGGEQHLSELLPRSQPGLALVFEVALRIEDDAGAIVHNNLGLPEELIIAERLANIGNEVERLVRLHFERGD